MGTVVPVFIYALVSTRDNLPRYVGQSVDVFGRLRIHMQCLKPSPDRRDAAATFGKPVYDWIRGEVNAGFQIEARILEECPDKYAADKREAYWISQLRGQGHQLTNETTGNGRRTQAWRAKTLAEQREALVRDKEWLEDLVIGIGETK